MNELKKYRIIDNDFPTRSCMILAHTSNQALDIGASNLKTCNIRIIATYKKNESGKFV